MIKNKTKKKGFRNPYLIESVVFPAVTILFLILFFVDCFKGENGGLYLFLVFIFGALSFEFLQKYRNFKIYSTQFPKDVYDEGSLIAFMKEDAERMATSYTRRKTYERSARQSSESEKND